MSDDQDRCEWVNVSFAAGLPGYSARQRTVKLCVCVCCWCVIPKGLNEFSQFLLAFLMCFDAVVGRQEGHLACKKLSGGVLAWLSVWSEVQTCMWPS